MGKPKILIYRNYAIEERNETRIDVVAIRNYSETLARFRQRVMTTHPGYECLKVIISDDGEESFEKINEGPPIPVMGDRVKMRPRHKSYK